jgi:ABC-2 type transport system permease protein
VSGDRAIAARTARAAVRAAAPWSVVFTIYISVSALGYARSYPTDAERVALKDSFGSNVGINAILGTAHRIDTVAGFTAWRTVGVLGVVGGVWGLLLATRLTRGEEDAGRWELMLGGVTSRRRGNAAALCGLTAGLAALWVLPALGAVPVGRSSDVGFPVSAALSLALAAVLGAAVFTAVGALAAQLANDRRTAAACAGIALGIAYALRMIADSGTALEWLRWATPLGWVEQVRPLAGTRLGPLLLVVALVIGLSAATIGLAGRRDVGTGLIATRPDRAARTRLLGSATQVTVRLMMPASAGWLISICLGAGMVGLIAKSAGDAIRASASFRTTLATLGARGFGAQAYLGVAFLVIALLVSLTAASLVHATRAEEAEGRLEHLLVRPVSRTTWLVGRIGSAAAVLVLAGVVAAAAASVAARSQHAELDDARMVAAAINVVPPAIFVLGIGVLAFGVLPRAVPVATYGLVAWSFLVDIVGSVVKANHWMLDTSLFRHMAPTPAAPANWTVNSVLTASGVVLAAVGVAAFRRRDMTGE